MYKVRVENVCRCFLRSGMAEVEEFSTQDEAKAQAQKLIQEMNESFCQKHEFDLKEMFGDYTIYIKPRR